MNHLRTKKHTFLSTKSAQNLDWALSWGSEGNKGALSFHTSSIYWTIISDSQTGFPSWTRTGIFLWTGFIWRSKSLLFLKSCSLYSYFTPFSANAILTLIPNGLDQKSNRVTWSPAILEVKKKMLEVKLGFFVFLDCKSYALSVWKCQHL